MNISTGFLFLWLSAIALPLGSVALNTNRIPIGGLTDVPSDESETVSRIIGMVCGFLCDLFGFPCYKRSHGGVRQT